MAYPNNQASGTLNAATASPTTVAGLKAGSFVAATISSGFDPTFTINGQYQGQIGAYYSTDGINLTQASLRLAANALGSFTTSGTSVTFFVIMTAYTSGNAQCSMVTGLNSGGTGTDVVVTGSLPAGSNTIGNVGISGAIPAGANILGSVGIDQTTPGTTNGVEVTGNVLASAPLSAQITISVTGTAVAFPSLVALNGCVVSAHPLNAALAGSTGGVVGPSGVTQTTGAYLPPGATMGFAVANANAIFCNGIAGDKFSVAVS